MIYAPALAETLTQTITFSSSSGTYHPTQAVMVPNQLTLNALQMWTQQASEEINRNERAVNDLREQLQKLHQFVDWISVAHPHVPDEYRRATLATAVLEK